MLEKSVQEAENQKEAQAGTEHLLVAMLKETRVVLRPGFFTQWSQYPEAVCAVLTSMGIENPTAEELQGGEIKKTEEWATTPNAGPVQQRSDCDGAEGKWITWVGRDRDYD